MTARKSSRCSVITTPPAMTKARLDTALDLPVLTRACSPKHAPALWYSFHASPCSPTRLSSTFPPSITTMLSQGRVPSHRVVQSCTVLVTKACSSWICRDGFWVITSDNIQCVGSCSCRNFSRTRTMLMTDSSISLCAANTLEMPWFSILWQMVMCSPTSHWRTRGSTTPTMPSSPNTWFGPTTICSVPCAAILRRCTIRPPWSTSTRHLLSTERMKRRDPGRYTSESTCLATTSSCSSVRRENSHTWRRKRGERRKSRRCTRSSTLSSRAEFRFICCSRKVRFRLSTTDWPTARAVAVWVRSFTRLSTPSASPAWYSTGASSKCAWLMSTLCGVFSTIMPFTTKCMLSAASPAACSVFLSMRVRL
mmetsp:Transcript_28767/g.54317  ORF Transcript_28767/g.54317 Transcript_28767/m.54317 type:complete len:366 (+) Transcript_28767:2432-3529(+)